MVQNTAESLNLANIKEKVNCLIKNNGVKFISGTLTWKDGSSYSGPFIQNKPSGDGIFTDGQNKQKWVGKFGPRGALQLRHLLQISPSDE